MLQWRIWESATTWQANRPRWGFKLLYHRSLVTCVSPLAPDPRPYVTNWPHTDNVTRRTWRIEGLVSARKSVSFVYRKYFIRFVTRRILRIEVWSVRIIFVNQKYRIRYVTRPIWRIWSLANARNCRVPLLLYLVNVFALTMANNKYLIYRSEDWSRVSTVLTHQNLVSADTIRVPYILLVIVSVRRFMNDSPMDLWTYGLKTGVRDTQSDSCTDSRKRRRMIYYLSYSEFDGCCTIKSLLHGKYVNWNRTQKGRAKKGEQKRSTWCDGGVTLCFLVQKQGWLFERFFDQNTVGQIYMFW